MTPANDNEQPRLLSREAAATYLGVGLSTFSAWVRDGYMPAALPWCRRWDKRAIDAVLDKASGFDKSTGTKETALERWKRENAGGT